MKDSEVYFSAATIDAAKEYISIAGSGKVKPGRLGNPDLCLKDDERADPRMRAALDGFGMGGAPQATGLERSEKTKNHPTTEQLMDYAEKVETGVEQVT
eukprot:1195758-Prorocentrum_minimum.AAC.3